MDSHTSYLFLLSTYLFKSCPYARSMLSLSLSLSPYLSFVLFRCLNHSFPSIDHLFYPFYPMAVAFIYLQHTIHSLPPHPTHWNKTAGYLFVCLSFSLSVHWLLSSSALLLGQIETTYIPIFCSIPFPPVPPLVSLLSFH